MEEKKKIRETRSYFSETPTVEDGDSRLISGYAALFDVESKEMPFHEGQFVEKIAPGAFDGVIERSDVKVYLDHSRERGVLARSVCGMGTLTLSIDERGLKYSFEAPRTSLGDEVIESIRRGDLTASSFCFSVTEDSWDRGDGSGRTMRTIHKISELYDVSPVYDPAYPDTNVVLRSYERACSAGEPEEPAEEPKKPSKSKYRFM